MIRVIGHGSPLHWQTFWILNVVNVMEIFFRTPQTILELRLEYSGRDDRRSTTLARFEDEADPRDTVVFQASPTSQNHGYCTCLFTWKPSIALV
jgi:hypothetical protein